VTAAVALAACGGTTTSTTTAAGANTVPPITSDSVSPFPVTIDAYGRRVTIDAQPSQVVSLSATHTEILYAIGAGDLIAGTDVTSTYPPQAADTPKVDSFNFDAEEVLNLEPDLVIIAFDFSGELAAMEAAGVPTLLLPPATDLGDAFEQFLLVGLATGLHQEAQAEVLRLGSAIDEIVAGHRPPPDPLSFFHEVDETLFTTNSTTFLGQLYALFGLENIADEAPDEFGSGFPQLSAEYILEADPDLIFLGDAAFGVSAEVVAERPGWAQLSAVANGHVFDLDAEISGRWGPRTDQVVQQIFDALGSLS
jgi:iron complex transport system substrate-binding protein